jgi:Cu-processing system ATP-binding protein
MTEITIDGVDKRYGDVTSLEDVSLQVPAGSTFGLLGTNGAGKTTLFRLLVGHERPDGGTLKVAGRSPAEGASIRRTVGYLPENAGFPGSFTGREVLSFHADVRGVAAKDDAIARTLEAVGLSEEADRRVGGYSNGMNRRLGLATVLLADPEVLLLDEPFSGLDPLGVDALHDVLGRLSTETSMTIVVASHALFEIERLCDRIAILDGGTVRRTGTTGELRRSAGDTVSLQFRTVDGDAIPGLLDRLAEAATVRTAARVDDERLRVRCARLDVTDVIADVHDRVAVDGFEVREPDLGDVFRSAVRPDAAREPPERAVTRERGGEP